MLKAQSLTLNYEQILLCLSPVCVVFGSTPFPGFFKLCFPFHLFRQLVFYFPALIVVDLPSCSHHCAACSMARPFTQEILIPISLLHLHGAHFYECAFLFWFAPPTTTTLQNSFPQIVSSPSEHRKEDVFVSMVRCECYVLTNTDR